MVSNSFLFDQKNNKRLLFEDWKRKIFFCSYWIKEKEKSFIFQGRVDIHKPKVKFMFSIIKHFVYLKLDLG